MNDDLRLCSVAMCSKQHVLLQTKQLQVQCRDIVAMHHIKRNPVVSVSFLLVEHLWMKTECAWQQSDGVRHRYLEAGFQQGRGKVRVELRGEQQSEGGVGHQTPQGLFQHW